MHVNALLDVDLMIELLDGMDRRLAREDPRRMPKLAEADAHLEDRKRSRRRPS